MVKYSRPDISYAVRELSKGMKEVTPDAMKESKQVVNFVLSTKNLGLKWNQCTLRINGMWWDTVTQTGVAILRLEEV